MGIIFSLMSLSIGAQPSPAKRSAKHLQQLFSFAQEEAILTGKVLGWHLNTDEYKFYRHVQQKWQLITQDKILQTQALASVVEYELLISGMQAKKVVQNMPQIIFMPDGSVTEFELLLSLQNEPEKYRLWSQQDKIKLEVKP